MANKITRLATKTPDSGVHDLSGGQGERNSAGQVYQVVRDAAAGAIPVLREEISRETEAIDRWRTVLDDPRLSHSLLSGLTLLAALPTDGSLGGLTELARACEMHPSTAHRYISTLVVVGLAERDQVSRRYRRVHRPLGGEGTGGQAEPSAEEVVARVA